MGWRHANQKETANLKPLAIVSLHASPVAALGAGENGGMNVYVRAVGEELSRRGIATEVFTRRSNAQGPDRIRLAERAWVTRLAVGPAEEIDKARLFDLLPDFSEAILSEQRRRRTGYSLIHSHYWLSGWVARACATSGACPGSTPSTRWPASRTRGPRRGRSSSRSTGSPWSSRSS